MSDNPNKIQRLQLENFTCFERADLEFSPGINVFIGENGTGKTHLLKVIYTSLNSKELLSQIEAWKEYFNIDSTIFLKRFEDKRIIIQIHCYNGKHISSKEIFIAPQGNLIGQAHASFGAASSLYIPPPEMLSWQKGFINIYERQENGFDKTFRDLAVALNGEKLKNSYLEKAQILANKISNTIKADVYRKDGRFYFKFENTEKELEASIVAQGINKLGQLYYLILNGSLTKDTILFWDEPETGLNPKYIKVVAQFLQSLANAGVQIFVATHDYLLTHYLSLAAEYREQTQAPDMKFFALYKGENGTEIETGATLGEIQNDAILEEYAAYYDLETELFKETVTKP